MSKADEWEKARKFVAEHPELAEMDSHAAIYKFCDSKRHTGKTLWPKVRRELEKQYNIDYAELKAQAAERTAQRAEELKNVGDDVTRVELYTFGEMIERQDSSFMGAFAITDSEGADQWYGNIHRSRGIETDPAAATEAVCSAIWLAGKVREDADLEVIAATIHHSYPDIDADRVDAASVRNSVAVTLTHVDAENNPASVTCLEKPGYRDWQEIRLRDLITYSPAPA
ncbi:hypothetical protein AXK56_16445 [Tsukamurella pulmonis]|nr:hypothetical protein AXK56_16445 [Tsukamurella pulmonis]